MAQVNFYTIASPAVINKDDYFNYTIVFENPGSILTSPKPNLTAFTIIKGPEQFNEYRKVNGAVIPFISLKYLLQPKQPGRFTIDPVVAVIAGKKYKSNVTAVFVNNTSFKEALTGKAPRPAMSDFIFHPGDSLAEKINRNMLFSISLDRKSCYVGEPIIAECKLYSRLENTIPDRQNTSFNGFSVIDMLSTDMTPTSNEMLNGKEYSVSTLRRAQLYPLQAGTINIESAELQTDVHFVRGDYTSKLKDSLAVYHDFLSGNLPPSAEMVQSFTLKSIPVDIIVKPLPETDRPASFKGAVGNFQVRAALQKMSFSADEAGKLSVLITGSGNMRLLTAPDIEWPKGIEAFEPKFSEKLIIATVPISGTKSFEYSFSANDTGQFTIPAIRFSYFDPSTEKYKVISTEPIIFRVNKTQAHTPDLSHIAAASVEPSFLNNIFNHRWWVVIFIAVVMFTAVFMWAIKDKKEAVVQLTVASKEEEQAINELLEASANNQQNAFPETEKCLYEDNCFGFYTLLNTELKNYLSHRFSLDVNAVNSNTIMAVLDRNAIDNNIALQLQQLMQTIEWQLYTPFERNDKMNALYQEAHDVVQMINTVTSTNR